MSWNEEKIRNVAERIMKDTKQYQETEKSDRQENYEISCIFLKGNMEKPGDIVVYAEYADDYLSLYPLDNQWEASWSLHFDSEVFQVLEKGYQIVSMTDEFHYNLWTMLGEHEDEKVIYKKGFKKYVEYCRQHGITKSYLQEKTSYCDSNIDVLYHKKMRISQIVREGR